MLNVFMDVLPQRLRASKLGRRIGHLFMGALGHIDDVLIAPTALCSYSMLCVRNACGKEYQIREILVLKLSLHFC